MAPVGYRDGDAVVREMLAGKRADALSRARSFGYAQRSVLDERAIAEVEALHDRTMPFLFDDVTGAEDARRVIVRVDELIAAYDTLMMRSSALLVPGPLDVEAAFAPPEEWRGTSVGAARLAREVRIDRGAVERFEVRDQALAVAAGPWALIVGLDEGGDESRIEGRISIAIPAAVPVVSFRPERGPNAMLQDLGVQGEIETADPRFDDGYWIQGHREAAFAAATPLVRRLMVEMREHVCTLEIGGGAARLAWSAPWTALGPSGVPANLISTMMELRSAFCE